MLRYVLAAAVITLPIAAAIGQSDEGPPRWAANIVRKQQVIMQDIPEPYAGMHDPTSVTSVKLQRGRMLFERNCAACHGSTGAGTGPDAFAQVPAPADLEWLASAPRNRSEPYMYWTVAEGGQAFDSEMPAFKDKLGEKDIWAVIAYVSAGLPRRSHEQ